ncbi:SDR family NAD(P)-dependent oxidoreductase, partial [Enterobacter roggenkampii]
DSAHIGPCRPAAPARDIWSLPVVAVNVLRKGAVIPPTNMVDGPLGGLARGKPIPIPPMHDVSLWDRYEAARLELFNSARTGIPAPRYVKQ